MRLNQRGYTLNEFISVVVILTVIALIASPIILEIISEQEEKSRIMAVEEYIKRVNNTVKIYMDENPDIVIDNNLICSSFCNDKCLVDATENAIISGTISESCTSAKLAVTYDESPVVLCNSVIYNQLNNSIEVKGCQVEGDIENSYSGNDKKGITNDNGN